MSENTGTAGEATPVAADKTVGFPCRGCGSQMTFSPEKGRLVCPYCGGEEVIDSPREEAPEYLYFPDEDRYDAPDWEKRGARALVCPSCGAETLMSAAAMTATCPFCGAHYVTEPEEGEKIIAPETMVPFRIPEGEALKRFHQWAKRQWLSPRAFRRGKKAADMKGVYVPYWTFDAVTRTHYDGFGGRQRTETYTTRENGRTVTRTRTVTDWYPISGEHDEDFDDIPCPATRKVERKLLDRVGPFSMKVLNVYNPAYLAGFFAERYSVGLGEGFAVARARMEAHIAAAIQAERGYDTYRGMHYDYRYERVKFKHILLPIWLSSYTYREKIFQFLVNGESGRVAGHAPRSFWKIFLLVVGGLGLLALLIWFLCTLDL